MYLIYMDGFLTVVVSVTVIFPIFKLQTRDLVVRLPRLLTGSLEPIKENWQVSLKTISEVNILYNYAN